MSQYFRIRNRKYFIKIAGLWLALVVVVGLFSIYNSVTPVQSQGTPTVVTPTSLIVALKKVELSETGRTYKTILDTPSTLDVITDNGSPFGTTTNNPFGDLPFQQGTYKSLRLTLAGAGTFRGKNPCTGITPDPPVDQDIQLPGQNSDGEAVFTYTTTDVLGRSLTDLPLQTITVGSNPLELRLVFLASNSIICASSAEPLRIISGTDTELTLPVGIALFSDPIDPSKDEIVVANSFNNTVTIYQRTDDRNSPPLRFINGSSTELSGPAGIAIFLDQSIPRDPTKDEIIVTNSGDNSVTFYDRTKSGNIFPIHAITGASTGLNRPKGVYADTTHDEIVVANSGNNSITIYSRADVVNSTDGNVEPVRTIRGSNTRLSSPVGIAIFLDQSIPRDPTKDEIIVTNSGDNSITIYNRMEIISMTDPSTKIANVFPARTISGTSTRLSVPEGIYIDMARDEIGVANSGNNTVTIYSRTAPGNVIPLRVIRGALTGLSSPRAVAVFLDPGGNRSNDEVIVVNSGNNSVTVHNREDASAQVDKPPILISSDDTQSPLSPSQDSLFAESLFAQYLYSGTVDKSQLRDLGLPCSSSSETCQVTGEPATIPAEGNLIWRLTRTDPHLPFSNESVVGNAVLKPPDVLTLTLTGNPQVNRIFLGCNTLIKGQGPPLDLVTLTLETPNCRVSSIPPLIALPVPLADGVYTIPHQINTQPTPQAATSSFVFTSTPLQEPQFPRPIHTITVINDGTKFPIDKIEWSFSDPNPKPIIFSQQILILVNLPCNPGTILPDGTTCDVTQLDPATDKNGQECKYKSAGGGLGAPKATLIFPDPQNPQTLNRNDTSLTDVTNEGCQIFLRDVKTIRYIIGDALGTTFIFDLSLNPQISSLSPTSGPVGTQVTISGFNFGAAQGTSTVTFNSTPATSCSWSDTSIVCPVPAGATTGPVVVTVDGVSSNGLPVTLPSNEMIFTVTP